MITEEQLKTYLHCPTLHSLAGTIFLYHPSQLLIYESLKDFQLKIITNNIDDFNSSILFCIKKNIKKFYPDKTSIDDTQYLINYCINLFTDFFKKYPIDKYTPVAVNFNPNFGQSLQLQTDLILIDTKTHSNLHIVNFYPRVIESDFNLDYFSTLKIDFFKNAYSHLNNKMKVTVNYFSASAASFRNRSQRNYIFQTIATSKVKKKHRDFFKDSLNYYNESKNNTFIKPYCTDLHCVKREECQNG